MRGIRISGLVTCNLTALCLFFGALNQANALQAIILRCEFRTSPISIQNMHPRLSWELTSDIRGDRQTACEVQVASSRVKLMGQPDFVKTGKIASTVPWADLAKLKLKSMQECWWRVRVWDLQGRRGPWSTTAKWEMGICKPEDWKAKWISDDKPAPKSLIEMYADSPAPLLRTEFTLPAGVKRARAYITGLGYYEFHLNGKKVGNLVLDPGWTDYSKRTLYSVYDVTSQLRLGRNAVGMMLGNGWFNPLPLPLFGRFNLQKELFTGKPRALLQIVIEMIDGSIQTIQSDRNWKTAPGPILRNSIYLGEKYDARLEKTGWNLAGYSDAGWKSVNVSDASVVNLVEQSAPPIRATRELRPVRVWEHKPGVWLFDMAQNFAGWAKLRVQGLAGTEIKLRFGELLHKDGSLNVLTSCCGQIKRGAAGGGPGAPETAEQSDTYILKGGGPETYTPRFTWHGFRYVEVTGLPNAPDKSTITGLRLNSDVETAGTFTCSNPLYNRIYEMVDWTFKSNMFSVQSDCPHRERLGYGGDIVASSEAEMLMMDMNQFYAKAATDLADAQRTNGGITETAPFVGIADEGFGGGSGPIGWGTAFPLLLSQRSQYYGDSRQVENYYSAVKRWIYLLKKNEKNGIINAGIGDHESLAPKAISVSGTAFYYFNLKFAAELAGIFGQKSERDIYASEATRVKAAFNREFLDGATGKVSTGTQACQAFALYFELLDEPVRTKALAWLVRDIVEVHGGHLTTGIFGTKYMLDVLSRLGRADIAATIVGQKTFPGWGNMLEHGATTLWEHWEYEDRIYSHNHPMFGSVVEWMMKHVAGIAPAAGTVGFQSIDIHPNFIPGMEWAKGSYRTPYGVVKVEWRRPANGYDIVIDVPAGCVANVFLQIPRGYNVELHGTMVGSSSLIGRQQSTDAVFRAKLESGKYQITANKP